MPLCGNQLKNWTSYRGAAPSLIIRLETGKGYPLAIKDNHLTVVPRRNTRTIISVEKKCALNC